MCEPAVSLPGPADDWEAPLFPPFPLRCIDCGCSLELSIRHDRDVNRPLADCIEPLDTSGHAELLEPCAKARRIENLELAVPDEDVSDHESAAAPTVPLEFDSFCFVANALSGIAHMAGIASGPSSKTAQLPWRDDVVNIRALCGAQLPSAPGCCTAYATFPAGYELCRRLGCVQGPVRDCSNPSTLVPPKNFIGDGLAPIGPPTH